MGVKETLETKKPTTEETLQSIDSTLKRIEVILCQKNHTSLEVLKAAFVEQSRRQDVEYRFVAEFPELSELLHGSNSEQHG